MAYAALVHSGQKRKGTNISYVCRLMSVSALVMEYGGDEDQALAGLLHDALGVAVRNTNRLYSVTSETVWLTSYLLAQTVSLMRLERRPIGDNSKRLIWSGCR